MLPPPSGSTFHSLKLLAHCGGGAYGDVYYCEDISGRKMAVKIVSKKKLGDAWERELRGVVNYRKITESAPELLQIFHVEEDEETFFYTMEAADPLPESEYAPDTLAVRLKQGPLPANAVFETLSAIFAGIRIIHEAGFAHRDIKPDNILFVGGVPKLGDIGLVSSLTTTMTQLAGTMDFLPPELRIEDGATSSDRLSRQRNDLYAFGKVIYCTITGQSPHAWPSMPKELPLTPLLKLFLRLSMQLCDKDPLRHLNDISEVQQELADIKRKLTSGETLRDKIMVRVKGFFTNVRSAAIHALKFLGRHWLATALLLIAAGGSLWYFWPKPPFDLSQQQIKTYTNESLGFTMTIPFQWEVLSAETMRKLFDEVSSDEAGQDPLEKKRAEFFKELLQLGGDFIWCDLDETFSDNIAIQPLPPESVNELDIPDDELRLYMRQLFQGELGFKTEIYEIRRMTLKGKKCIFVDLSHEPQKTRTNNYLFLLPDRAFTLALTAKTQTFPDRREQFSQILDTLRFTK